MNGMGRGLFGCQRDLCLGMPSANKREVPERVFSPPHSASGPLHPSAKESNPVRDASGWPPNTDTSASPAASATCAAQKVHRHESTAAAWIQTYSNRGMRTCTRNMYCMRVCFVHSMDECAWAFSCTRSRGGGGGGGGVGCYRVVVCRAQQPEQLLGQLRRAAAGDATVLQHLAAHQQLPHKVLGPKGGTPSASLCLLLSTSSIDRDRSARQWCP